jgi:hypothetical protein
MPRTSAAGRARGSGARWSPESFAPARRTGTPCRAKRRRRCCWRSARSRWPCPGVRGSLVARDLNSAVGPARELGCSPPRRSESSRPRSSCRDGNRPLFEERHSRCPRGDRGAQDLAAEHGRQAGSSRRGSAGRRGPPSGRPDRRPAGRGVSGGWSRRARPLGRGSEHDDGRGRGRGGLPRRPGFRRDPQPVGCPRGRGDRPRRGDRARPDCRAAPGSRAGQGADRPADRAIHRVLFARGTPDSGRRAGLHSGSHPSHRDPGGQLPLRARAREPLGDDCGAGRRVPSRRPHQEPSGPGATRGCRYADPGTRPAP